MEITKIIVLLLVGVVLVCLPIFIFLFIKTFYHYQKMIFGVKKDVYSKGYFVLGPFLLTDAKYFDEIGQESRIHFFRYLKKTTIVFSILALAFLAINVIKNSG